MMIRFFGRILLVALVAAGLFLVYTIVHNANADEFTDEGGNEIWRIVGIRFNQKCTEFAQSKGGAQYLCYHTEGYFPLKYSGQDSCNVGLQQLYHDITDPKEDPPTMWGGGFMLCMSESKVSVLGLPPL